jgi:hypothetical protein
MGCTTSNSMILEVEKLHDEVNAAMAEREKLKIALETKLAQSRYKQKLLKEMVSKIWNGEGEGHRALNKMILNVCRST